MTRAVWDELNARPIKAPPAWVRNRAWVEPITPPPLVGRVVKPRAAGPCKVCGERRFFCDCEIQGGGGAAEKAAPAIS